MNTIIMQIDAQLDTLRAELKSLNNLISAIQFSSHAEDADDYYQEELERSARRSELLREIDELEKKRMWQIDADRKVPMTRPIVILSNGKRVANFSSPHPFTFTDGSILPPVTTDISELLKIVFHEMEYQNGDISLSFSLSPAVRAEMEYWQALWFNSQVNVVFCPLPMLNAIVQEKGFYGLFNSPFRGVRIEDRIKKLVSIDKQCIIES